MSEILGQIKKPSAEKFKEARKLYLVPLLFSHKDAPKEYQEKIAGYWKQVGEQLESLERKMGKINKVYHESIWLEGEQGLDVVKKINEKGYSLVKNKCGQGAELQQTEDMDLFTQSMDWGNCLRVVQNADVIEKVSGFFREVTQKRYDYIAKRIDETLKEGESGVLFVGENHGIQFPGDIQVFYVSPPALDEIHRWFREKQEKQDKRQDKAEEKS